MGREDFRVDPCLLRRGLLDNDHAELPITSQHAVNVVGELVARYLECGVLEAGFSRVRCDDCRAE